MKNYFDFIYRKTGSIYNLTRFNVIVVKVYDRNRYYIGRDDYHEDLCENIEPGNELTEAELDSFDSYDESNALYWFRTEIAEDPTSPKFFEECLQDEKEVIRYIYENNVVERYMTYYYVPIE